MDPSRAAASSSGAAGDGPRVSAFRFHLPQEQGHAPEAFASAPAATPMVDADGDLVLERRPPQGGKGATDVLTVRAMPPRRRARAGCAWASACDLALCSMSSSAQIT